MDRTPLRMLIAAGALAFLTAVVLMPRLTSANGKDSDVLMQVMGGTTDIAADAAYNEADVYFHGGVSDDCREEHDGNCIDKSPKLSASADLPLMKLIWYLDGETAPQTHRHLHGAEEKEILPWFVAAARLNPHLLDAWRTGSYWFYRSHMPKRAMDFISEGIRSNPNVYELYMERGILDHRLGMWKNAIEDLEEAQKLWKNNSPDAPYDARAIRTYLKNSREREEK